MRSLYHIFVHVAYGCGAVLFQQSDKIQEKWGNFGVFLPTDNVLQ